MAYELHGPWQPTTGIHTDFVLSKKAVEYYIDQGVPARKILYGFATYGRSFSVNGSDPRVGIQVTGAGIPGKYTREPSLLSYYEILEKASLDGSRTGSDETQMGAILTFEDQWVGYDTPETISAKIAWVKEMNLGGAMIWSIDLDDFRNGYPLCVAVAEDLIEIIVYESENSGVQCNPSWNIIFVGLVFFLSFLI